MPLALLSSMPKPDEIQVLILLTLIPTMIGTMYSLTQVSEHIRKRNTAKKRIADLARRIRSEQSRSTKPRLNSPA
jgi:hypothetical protein